MPDVDLTLNARPNGAEPGHLTIQAGYSEPIDGEEAPPSATLRPDGTMIFENIQDEVRDKGRVGVVIWQATAARRVLPGAQVTFGSGNARVHLTGNYDVAFEGFEPTERVRRFWEMVACMRPWELSQGFLSPDEPGHEPPKIDGVPVRGPTWHQRIIEDEG